MEKGNPHAMGAGASHVAGYNAEAPITALPNSAMLLTIGEAHMLAEALATIHRLSSRCSAVVIDKLDLADGDPDLEDDDPAEDDDPGEDDDDDAEHDGREIEDGI